MRLLCRILVTYLFNAMVPFLIEIKATKIYTGLSQNQILCLDSELSMKTLKFLQVEPCVSIRIRNSPALIQKF